MRRTASSRRNTSTASQQKVSSLLLLSALNQKTLSILIELFRHQLMEMRRLIGAYVAILHKIGKITHICRYKFHLCKLYHIMRYEGEWVVVSCRSLHRILTFAGNPWGQTLQKVRTAPLHGPYRPFHFVMRHSPICHGAFPFCRLRAGDSCTWIYMKEAQKSAKKRKATKKSKKSNSKSNSTSNRTTRFTTLGKGHFEGQVPLMPRVK